MKKKKEKKHLFCSLCYTRHENLCCQQVEKTNIFKSYKTGKTYKIVCQLTYKSKVNCITYFNVESDVYNMLAEVEQPLI